MLYIVTDKLENGLLAQNLKTTYIGYRMRGIGLAGSDLEKKRHSSYSSYPNSHQVTYS
jgi:hypothetical protein